MLATEVPNQCRMENAPKEGRSA